VPGAGRGQEDRHPVAVELKSRLDIPLDTGVPGAGAGGVPSAGGPSGAAAARADVREALAGLGYGLDEIRDVLADLPDGDDAGVLLKHALQRLAVSR
jgi:holliday junction DNA helicase RuvA